MTVLFGCGDSSEPARAAAHLYNSTDQPVTVVVRGKSNSSGTQYTLKPGEGWYVALNSAGTYVVETSGPSTQAYHEELVVPVGDETETLFDIGSRGRFSVKPTFHVSKDLNPVAAQSEVIRLTNQGGHREYVLNTPASKHTLPHAVYYTFGRDVEQSSRVVDADKDVEIRYKLSAIDQ